jgi:membrane-bound metal-dependent hydrolase YbcI (DUF457 family)
MRGLLHLVLHIYYLTLALAIVYGGTTELNTSNVLGSVLRVETLIPVLVFLDLARAPDCDLGSCRSLLGSLGYTLVKSFVRRHRGWYHSVWASLYIASLTAVITYLVALYVEYLGIVVPKLGITRTTFLTALLSYTLHLLEDGLTVRGVKLLGVRIRSFARTGSTDTLVATLLVLPSAISTVVHYITTAGADLATSAMVGATVLTLTYIALVALPKLAR